MGKWDNWIAITSWDGQSSPSASHLRRAIRRKLMLMIAVVLFAALTGCTTSLEKLKTKALVRAAKFEQDEQYINAIIEYKNALKADPTSQDLLFRLGNAYLEDLDYKGAFTSFERICELSPSNVDAQLAIGQIYLKTGMNDDALQLAKEIRTRSPNTPEPRLLLANAYAAKGVLPNAIAELELLVRDYPTLLAGHINLGIIYAAQGKMDLAEGETRRAVDLAPGSLSARKALGAIYLSRGKVKEAEAVYRGALQADPQSTEALIVLAEFYAMQNRQAESEQLYKQVVSAQHNSIKSRFTLASYYASQNRYDSAREIDKQITQTNPEYVPARIQLAELAVNNSNLAEAEAALAPLLQTQRQNIEVQIVHARILLREGKPQQAIDVLDGVISQGNLALAHYLLGVAYSQVGNPSRAQSEMEAAIAADSGMTDAYVGLGQMMLDEDKPKQALQYGQMALQKTPNSAQAFLITGTAYASMRMFVEAESALRQYAKNDQDSPDSLNRLGTLRIMQKRYPEAITLYEESLKKDELNLGGIDGVASTLLLMNDKAKAIQRINEALSKRTTPELLNLAGKIYAEAGEPGPAEGALKKSLQFAPGRFDTYGQLGALYARIHREEEAIKEFQAAVKVKPADVASWTMLGMLYERRGDFGKAQEAYSKALEFDPNSGIAANNLAWLYADHLNDLDKALELARRARVSFPNQPNISDTLGWIYARHKLYDIALPLLYEAVKANPRSAEYHYHLAITLLHLGRRGDSRLEMSEAIKLSPETRSRAEVKEIM